MILLESSQFSKQRYITFFLLLLSVIMIQQIGLSGMHIDDATSFFLIVLITYWYFDIPRKYILGFLGVSIFVYSAIWGKPYYQTIENISIYLFYTLLLSSTANLFNLTVKK